jgi:hypothetical protein
MKSKPSALKIVLIVWLVFSALYVAYGEYNRLNNFVAKRAYQAGLGDAVTEVIKQAQACKAFPVTFRDQGVQLINIECLKGGEEQ